MSILQNDPGLNNTVSGLLESILPESAGNSSSLIGNAAGASGVTDDLLHGLTDGQLGDGTHNVYNDVAVQGGVAPDIFNGGGVGIENTLAEHLPAIDHIPAVSQLTTALDPAADLVDTVNGTLVNIGENLSPGISNVYTLTGDVIGQSGILDDVATNIHDGTPSGAVLESYADVLGHGGILDNIGDGYGSGLESLVHQLNGVEGTLPVVSEVPALLGDIPDTVASTVNDLSPGATSNLTTTGDVIGPSGVVDDVLTNLSDGSLTGGVVASYDDVFARGGLINNLADGHGLGTESLVGHIASIANGLGSADGLAASTPLSDVLGHAGALLGDHSDAGSDSVGHGDGLTGLLGDHDIGGALDSLHLLDHHTV